MVNCSTNAKYTLSVIQGKVMLSDPFPLPTSKQHKYESYICSKLSVEALQILILEIKAESVSSSFMFFEGRLALLRKYTVCIAKAQKA